jgi:hypothetical protein
LVNLFFTSNALAEPCKIEMVDLTEALQSDGNAKVITASNLTDIYISWVWTNERPEVQHK